MMPCPTCGAMQNDNTLHCDQCGSSMCEQTNPETNGSPELEQPAQQTDASTEAAAEPANTESISAEESGLEMPCAHCGQSLPADAQFCPVCGQKAQQRLPSQTLECPGCHRPVENGQSFCPACGAKITPIQRACPACQQVLAEDDMFCPGCGMKVGAPPAGPCRKLVIHRANQPLFLLMNYDVFINGQKVAQLVSPGEKLTLDVRGDVICLEIKCTNIMERHRQLRAMIRLGAYPAVEMNLVYPGEIQIHLIDATIA